MLMENVRIHKAAYGIYRPAFENHAYRNLHISGVASEPFNRGMDDASAQLGTITVDGLTFDTGYGNKSTPLVQISDVNLSGDAATHFRNVKVNRPEQYKDRWPLVNRGIGPRIAPITGGVPIYRSRLFRTRPACENRQHRRQGLDGRWSDYKAMPPLTGDESRVAEVAGVDWPEVLEPVDDLPPATIITSIREQNGNVELQGVSHDNGAITKIAINGQPAEVTSSGAGVVDWQITLKTPANRKLTAAATDDAGNTEQQTAHRITLPRKNPLVP